MSELFRRLRFARLATGTREARTVGRVPARAVAAAFPSADLRRALASRSQGGHRHG